MRDYESKGVEVDSQTDGPLPQAIGRATQVDAETEHSESEHDEHVHGAAHAKKPEGGDKKAKGKGSSRKADHAKRAGSSLFGAAVPWGKDHAGTIKSEILAEGSGEMMSSAIGAKPHHHAESKDDAKDAGRENQPAAKAKDDAQNHASEAKDDVKNAKPDGKQDAANTPPKDGDAKDGDKKTAKGEHDEHEGDEHKDGKTAPKATGVSADGAKEPAKADADHAHDTHDAAPAKHDAKGDHDGHEGGDHHDHHDHGGHDAHDGKHAKHDDNGHDHQHDAGGAHEHGGGGGGGHGASNADGRHTHEVMKAIMEAERHEKAQFSAHVAADHAAINARAGAAIGSLNASAARQSGLIGGLIAAARGAVSSAIGAAIGRVDSAASREKQGVDQWHTQAVSKTHQSFQQTEQKIRQSGQKAATKSTQMTTQAATSASTQVNGIASQAQSTGSGLAGVGSSIPEAAEKKAKLANELTKDAVSKIKEGLPQLVSSLNSAAPGVAQSFIKAGTDAAQQIQQKLPGALKSLASAQHSAVAALTSARTQATHALQQIRTGAWASLASVEQRSHAQVTQTKGSAIGQVQSTAAAAHQSIDKGKAQVFATSERAVAQVREDIKGKDHVPAHPIIARLRKGFNQAEGKARGGARKVMAMLNATATRGSGAMAGITAGARRSATSVSSGATASANKSASATAAGMSKLRAQVVAKGNQAVQKVTQGLQKAETKFDSGIAKSLAQFGTKLTAAVTKGVTAARKPLADLSSRISSGQGKIEAKAQEEKNKKQHRNFFQKAWDAATGWIKAFASWVADHWQILLIIAVAILITVATLGIGTMIAGMVTLGTMSVMEALAATIIVGAAFGALEGGIDQVITNVAAGKPWSAGLGGAVLRGGVTGALTAGIGKFAGEGAKIGRVLAVSGASTVGSTAVDNAMQGNSWNEGLTLNLTAGLLAAGVGHGVKLRTGGGEAVADAADAAEHAPSKWHLPADEAAKIVTEKSVDEAGHEITGEE